MKKMIALILVLMLTLTLFVACKKDPGTETPDDNKPGTEQTPGGDNGNKPEDEEPGVIEHDNVGGLENTNQHDGNGTELPIVAMP
jgi:hypothetical protein